MKTLITCIALSLFAAAAVAAPNTLTEEELADGWLLLFDGETLFGWRNAGDADFKVVDGVITATKGSNSLLHTTSQWGNYVLKVDFRSAKGTNSGVFLRTPPKPDPKNPRFYEVNIADTGTNDNPTGSLVFRKPCTTKLDSEDWQTMEVAADGAKFTVKIDGQQVLDYTDKKPLGRGYIGLQFRIGKIEFRNVKLKPLGMKTIFNGKDLDGWKEYPKMATKVKVTEKGEMNLRGGRGQIETVGSYGDFTLQLECFVNGKGLNSGVFFRCIPGDVMMGYESQIENACIDGDLTKPKDHGTGGIFRRQHARRIVAKDFEWFRNTIHVDDRHISTWVNGIQVADWSDQRKPHENPRKGLRLEPGTIQFQGHDPGTDISFRNIQISTIPER